MMKTTHAIRRVSTADVTLIDELLNSTIEELIPDAISVNHGIRVIRIGPGDYTVETTADVDCGYTVCEHH